MKKNKKIALTVLLLGALITAAYKKNNIIVTGNIENQIKYTEYDNKAYIVYDYLPLSEDEINNEMEKLNIKEDITYPANRYKVLKFLDSNNNYKVMVVNIYVNYKKDNNKNLVLTDYTVIDAFSHEELFDTKDFINILSKNVVFDDVKILSCDNILEIFKIVNKNAVNENYDIENTNLTNFEVARLYISFINGNNRITYEDLNMKNAKIIF